MAYLFFIHLFTIYHAEGHYPLRYLSALIRPLGLPAYTNSDGTALRQRTNKCVRRANVPLCLFSSEVVSDFEVSKCIVRLLKQTWPTFPENTVIPQIQTAIFLFFIQLQMMEFDHSYAWSVVCSVKVRGSIHAQGLFAFQKKSSWKTSSERGSDSTLLGWESMNYRIITGFHFPPLTVTLSFEGKIFGPWVTDRLTAMSKKFDFHKQPDLFKKETLAWLILEERMKSV